MYIRLLESTPPSQNIPPFSKTICDLPRIYPSLPEYIPLFNKCMCDPTLPESTPPSQNIPPLFNNYMRPSQNIPLPPMANIPPFQQMYVRPYPPRIYPSLPESTPPFQLIYVCDNNYMRPSQNTTLPPEYTPFSTTVCDLPRIYPSLPEYRPNHLFNKCMCDPRRIYPPPPEYTPPFQQLHATLLEYTPPSQNIPPFQQLKYYATLPESTPPSQNPPTFSTNLCVRPSLSVTSAAPVCDVVAYRLV